MRDEAMPKDHWGAKSCEEKLQAATWASRAAQGSTRVTTRLLLRVFVRGLRG